MTSLQYRDFIIFYFTDKFT